MVNNLQSIVERYLGGQMSAPVAAMELLLEMPDTAHILRTLPTLRGDPARISELSLLFAKHAEGCATIVTMLQSGLDSSEAADSVDAGLYRVRRLFDYSVARNEEASVALYSLGNAELLSAATEEVVDVLDDWGVLGDQRDALEIGCGIGRFLVALSARLRSLVGLDISAKMVEVARRRTAGRLNVRALTTAGRDLSQFPEQSFDLVFSVDAFPYLVQSGSALVSAHFREVSRVLRPRGAFVIFNFAYGRSREQNAREVSKFGAASGLACERVDEAPFRLWNAVGYHLVKRSPAALDP
jgi:SAM-dependent methyltransferase